MFGEYRVGDVKYKDVNGDGKIDTYDQIAIGYTDHHIVDDWLLLELPASAP